MPEGDNHILALFPEFLGVFRVIDFSGDRGGEKAKNSVIDSGDDLEKDPV
jgi:hypothetical protein